MSIPSITMMDMLRKDYFSNLNHYQRSHIHTKMGMVMMLNLYAKKDDPTFIVGKDSVVDDLIPEFKQGYGCCHYSGGYNLHCYCGNHIANLHLDCYEDGSVRFLQKEVNRLY